MIYYIVDAFAEKMFAGNQAGVCVLDAPIDEDLMQNIAIENNFSETAFLVNKGPGDPKNKVEPGTAFEDIKGIYMCPICGLGKAVFKKEE